MKKNFATILIPIAVCLTLALPSQGWASRIKDLTEVEGSRDNQLTGYGLVIGLAGGGDSTLSYTIQSISNMLERYGIKVPPESIKADNCAAVMVTADIGPFAKPGSRLDVTVSSIGDAETLQGGVLLQTPLEGADGLVYAVAQGPIAVGGFIGGAGGPGGASVQKNHPTVGAISSGAIIEREIEMEILQDDGSFNLMLLNPDYTTAVRIADAINIAYLGSSQALDSRTVNVRVPKQFLQQIPNFLSNVGGLEATPDMRARVVINERTGTIVATSNVRVSKVAISHGSLTITIASNLNVSQPNALGEGETTVTPSTQTEVEEKVGAFHVVEDLPTIQRFTTALNALGVSTREMMSILQAMKKAGALQAEVIIN